MEDSKEFIGTDAVEPTVESDIIEVSPEDDKRVRRKLDIWLMPMLWWAIAFQFVRLERR